MNTLADLGESGVLARILPLFSQHSGVEVGPGDDAALLTVPSGRIIITTDTMIEGHDFLLSESTGEEIGAKAAVQNLADVAAMGARPTALVVSISAPPSTPVQLLEAMARGLASRSSAVGASVVGGDLGSGPRVCISVTAVGELAGEQPVLRSGARPGDVVALGAPLIGCSAAGLAMVLGGVRLEELPATVHELAAVCLALHKAPSPDFLLGAKAVAAGRAPSAMLDVSDGLLRDAGRIADASRVSIQLDDAVIERMITSLLPLSDALHARTGSSGSVSLSAANWVLTGGEEHCMLAAFPPAVWAGPADGEGSGQGPGVPGFTAIGRVVDRRESVPVITSIDGGNGLGWDHFTAAAQTRG